MFFDDLFAVSLCGMFHHVMHFPTLLCCFLREAWRKDVCQINGSCSAACTRNFKNCGRKQLTVDGHFHNKAQMLQKTKSRGFPETTVDIGRHK